MNEGYLETVVGSGTFVCQQILNETLQSLPLQSRCPGASSSSGLSQYAQNFVNRAFPKQRLLSPEIDFCYWRPALDQFPLDVWRQITTRHLQSFDLIDYSSDLLGY